MSEKIGATKSCVQNTWLQINTRGDGKERRHWTSEKNFQPGNRANCRRKKKRSKHARGGKREREEGKSSVKGPELSGGKAGRHAQKGAGEMERGGVLSKTARGTGGPVSGSCFCPTEGLVQTQQGSMRKEKGRCSLRKRSQVKKWGNAYERNTSHGRTQGTRFSLRPQKSQAKGRQDLYTNFCQGKKGGACLNAKGCLRTLRKGRGKVERKRKLQEGATSRNLRQKGSHKTTRLS